MKHYIVVESSENAGVCIGAEVGGAIHHGGRQREREVSVRLEEMAAGDWGPPEAMELGIQGKPLAGQAPAKL